MKMWIFRIIRIAHDNPKMQQWDVFGYQIGSQDWPKYFEEKNEFWRWLSPGVLLYKREAPEQVTTLASACAGPRETDVLPSGSRQGVCVPINGSFGRGGQQVEVLAKAFSQEGELLWQKEFPKQEMLPGDNQVGRAD